MSPESVLAAPAHALNASPESLPPRCDALVVGAGPAGSAAALTLARAGFDVVLVDQHAFPRDKVCGDALIPDAHQALRRLGVLDAVMALAQPAGHVACVAPRGGRIDVPGVLAVLPRRALDLLLAQAAVAAGVRMHAPLRFTGTLDQGERVVGARLQAGDTTHELRADWVVLASGAVPQALIASNMATRQTPSGVALRGYVRNPAMVGRIDKLEVVWHEALSPGYGWIFPCRDGVFNIGVGVSNSHAEVNEGDRVKGRKQVGRRALNLREVFDGFTRLYAPARELMQGAKLLGPMKGAPLRCSLEGARFTRPGLMVTGEAAGSTYSFTGEGIGKALETGMLAAETIATGRRRKQDDAAVRAAYEAALMALKPRFALYARANFVNRWPWLFDLLIWRASKSDRLMRRMAGVLDETSNPGHLLTMRGFTRLFIE